MSADNRTTTLSWHIDGHLINMLVDMSTDKWPIYWSICLPTYRLRGGLYINWDISCVTVDISTNIPVDMLINISTEGCKDPRKVSHFLKNVFECHCWSKGSCWRDTVFWVTSSFAWNCFRSFFQCRSRLRKSCFLIGYLNWQDGPVLSTQDFQCLSPTRKFSFWWEYKMFQLRWVDIVFLDHYTFLEG